MIIIFYLEESDFGIGVKKNLVTFSQATRISDDSNKWNNVMQEELKFIYVNKV